MTVNKFIVAAMLAMPLVTQAQGHQMPPKNIAPACQQIFLACKANKFVVGMVKQGYGLWMDCLCPIVARNDQQPKNATDKNLPAVQANCTDPTTGCVNPTWISQCQAQMPPACISHRKH